MPKVFSLPTVPAMISWKSMRTSSKKCLGRLLQWKQTALFGIVAVVVVPVEQRAGRLGRQGQGVHAERAARCRLRRRSGIRSLLIMLMIVQGTTPKYSSIAVQHCTALIDDVGLLHPVVDDEAELGHLDQRFRRDAVGGDVLLNLCQLGLHVGVVVFQARNAAEDFGKIDGLRW